MLLGFKPQFAEPILNGTKIFTIRKKRNRMPEIGETLYMYTGLRTPKCKVITRNAELKGIQQVDIEIAEDYISINVDGVDIQNIEQFVKFDGFKSVEEFRAYWLRDEKGKPVPAISCKGLCMFHWTNFKY